MKFNLTGRIVLNKSPDLSLSGFQKDLTDFFSEANEMILTKGAPDGKGAVVTDWTLNDDNIQVTIISGRYVRAHDALLRLKKHLGIKFGKKYQLGARSVVADNYDIEFAIDRPPLAEIKVPFVKTIRLDGEALTCNISFENLSEEFLRQNYIDRIIKLVNHKIADQYYAGKTEQWEVMWSSVERDHVWSKDPTDEMQRLGWLKQGPTKGKWFYKPQLTAILRAMEQLALDHVLYPLGFQEVIQSHLVPFDIWLRTGHIAGTPNEFYYVSEPLTRDVDAWQSFRDTIYVTNQVPVDELKELITVPSMGICYAQCPGIYWSFQGSVIAEDSLPVLIFDRAANSNRYESGGRHGIERVDEFHRLEPIYIGHPEQLVELRENLIERYKYVFNEVLELEWRMAWVTPWYLEQSGQVSEGSEEENGKVKGNDKNGDSVKLKGTIDFEAYLPYRGTREESEWLEYQNLSIIGDKFIDSFNIKTQRGELWSGCSGIGLERWAAVFLAQKGLDPVNWPDKFRDVLGELPVGYRTL